MTTSEANRFLDLLGLGGGLSEGFDVPHSQATAVEKRQAPKFHAGETVRVKSTKIEGRVCLWTGFFQDNRYYVTFPGSYYLFLPVREREERLGADAKSLKEYGYDSSPNPWHDEGPFDETELEGVP